MTLTEKSINTLELPKVLQLLAREAVSDQAKERCLALRPESALSRCNLLQQQTADAVLFLGLHGSPPFSGLKDVRDSLDRAEKGGSLNPGELLTIASLLRAARVTRDYRQENKEEKTSIDDLFFQLTGNKYLEDKITSAIVSEEEISDHASTELAKIRKDIRTATSKVRDVLNHFVTSQHYSKVLQDSVITQRGGRFVVPVKSEHRSSVAGLVHDVSSSGATVFIEPSQVVELNNNIRMLGSKEQAEIERILAELSAEAADYAGSIVADFDALCSLDYIFARGKLAYNMKAMRPELCDNGGTRIIKGRHPLLAQDTAVPITFTIGGGTDTVIITGPNTGGKTVSIKTLGLLTAMAQCGLHIPAGDESRIQIFDQILADIGDEQSIEQSLSTFSSHMTNIVEILQGADNRTLVLLDELGAGTDPVEGAALATSIIEYMRKMGCTMAVTTHYAELKVYALETTGVENASCEFDVQTLRPTYRLVFGVPGKSNAFAISKRLGLNDVIIDAARESITNENKAFEDVIARLEDKRQALEAQLSTAEEKRRQAEQMNEKARQRLDNLDAERDKLIQQARKTAKEIIDNAKAAGDMALEQARRAKEAAENPEGDVNLSAARAAFRETLSTAQKNIPAGAERRRAIPPPRPLEAGDEVEIIATKTRGTVIEAPGADGKLKVQAGILKITVGVEEVELRERQQSEKPEVTIKVAAAKPENTSANLDLRGQNGDEAIMEIDRFIDSAIRLRLESVTIIHGKGTGALRTRVHAHLKHHPQVKSFRLGVFGEGEAGVTIATLK